MKKLRIMPYGPSDSVNELVTKLKADGVDVKKIKEEGSRYLGNRDHIILNWGSTNRRCVHSAYRIFNDPQAVAIATSKVNTFVHLKESGMLNNLPIFTTEIEEAKSFVRNGRIVFCRTLTRASQGRGIVIAHTEDEVVPAPLYTVRCKRSREIRVHVFNGSVIDFAQKKRMSPERLAEEDINLSGDIRSHSNGWVFAREGITIPESARIAAIDAVSKLGLDFGAVDIALSLAAPKIFEVNTAPGVAETTLNRYVEAIKNLLVSSDA